MFIFKDFLLNIQTGTIFMWPKVLSPFLELTFFAHFSLHSRLSSNIGRAMLWNAGGRPMISQAPVMQATYAHFFSFILTTT